MIANRSMPSSTVTPVLVYPDLAQAVDWLCEVFGFTERVRIGSHRSHLGVFSVRRRCRPGGMGRHRRDRPSVAVRARIGPSSPRGRSSAGARTEELHESVERAVIGRTRGIRPSGANSARRAGYCGRNLSDAELMQYLSPVGLGPSSNTCPKWAPQLAHSTSVRRMNRLLSCSSRTFPS